MSNESPVKNNLPKLISILGALICVVSLIMMIASDSNPVTYLPLTAIGAALTAVGGSLNAKNKEK